MDEIKFRVCPRCKNKFQLCADNFYRNKAERSGFLYQCKECAKVIQKGQWKYVTQKARALKSHKKKYHVSHRASSLMSAYRSSDKRKGIYFDITKAKVIELLLANCVYCGDGEVSNMGVDRIDNTIGHIDSNVISCCHDCNTARSDHFTFEEMKIIGETIRVIKQLRKAALNIS